MISITVTTNKVNMNLFMDNLRNEVLPQMNAFPGPESVLVLDNASTHDHLQVETLCAQFGVICVFLPPFSYDFSAIEPMFHEAKQYIRTKYGLADGVVSDRLYEALHAIPAAHALNYYSHVGHVITDADKAWAGV